MSFFLSFVSLDFYREIDDEIEYCYKIACDTQQQAWSKLFLQIDWKPNQ